MISCEQHRDLHPRLCLSRVRETIVDAHSAQQRKLGPLPEADRSIESPFCPICFSTAHCGAWVSSTEKGEKPSLKGIEPAQAHPQGFCCSNLESDLFSLGRRGSLSTGEDWPRTWLYPAISSPTPYQGHSCWHALSKDMTCVHIKSSTPTKGIGHICIGTLPRNNTPSGPQ